MPDYMFLLESRLSPEQHALLERVQELARSQELNLYLTGGAVRDLISGQPIRDLDFTVEGNPVRIVRELEKGGARIVTENERLRYYEMVFAGDVDGSIARRARRRVFPSGRQARSPLRWHYRGPAATRFLDQCDRDFAECAVAGVAARPHERPRRPRKAGGSGALHSRFHQSSHSSHPHSSLLCSHGIQDGVPDPGMVRSRDPARAP